MHRSRLHWRTKLAPSQPLRHDNPLHPTAYTSRISVQSYPAVDQESDATLVKTRRTRVGTRFRSKSGLRPNLTMPRPCALHPTSATHDTVSHTLSQELDRSNATRGTDAETVGLKLGYSTTVIKSVTSLYCNALRLPLPRAHDTPTFIHLYGFVVHPRVARGPLSRGGALPVPSVLVRGAV